MAAHDGIRLYLCRPVLGAMSRGASIRNGESVEEALLKVATRRIARVGYSATSMRDIADDVGVAVAASYHHFEGKSAILREIVERGYRELNARLAAVIESETGPDATLEALVRELVLAMMAEFDFATAARFDRRAILDTMGGRYGELRDVATGLLESALRDGQGAGLLRDDIDHRTAGRIISGMWNWLPDWSLPERDGGRRLAESLARIARYGVLGGASIDGRSLTTRQRRAKPRPAKGAAAGSVGRSGATLDRREERLAKIHNDAARGFAEVGYDAAGLADLCRWTNISRGALYRYIGSKQELLVAIMTNYIDAVSAAVDAVDIEEPAETLRRWATAVVTVQRDRTSAARIVLNERRALPPADRDRITARLAAVDSLPRAIIPRLAGLREPPDIAANALLGMVHASHLWFREGELSPDELARFTVDIFLRGMTPNRRNL
ncbi:MAG: TetR family transcriptional regulator [Ilumatobacteraceae bacterium]